VGEGLFLRPREGLLSIKESRSIIEQSVFVSTLPFDLLILLFSYLLIDRAALPVAA
jgi:hypothetical protein